MRRHKTVNDYGSTNWAIRVSAGFRDFGYEVTPDSVIAILRQIENGTHNQGDPVAIMIAKGRNGGVS